MSKQVAIRRDTTANNASFVGVEGEVTYDTQTHRLISHDGIRAGGYPSIHENGSNGLNLTLTGNSNISSKDILLEDSTKAHHILISNTGVRLSSNGIDRFILNVSTNQIKDSSNKNNVDFQNRILYNNTPQISLNWNVCQLLDPSDSSLCVSWNGRGLYNHGPTLTLDWENSKLYHGNDGIQTLDWNNRILYRDFSSSPVVSLNWDTQKCYDQAGIESLNWNNRTLKDSAGNTIVDWGNGYYYAGVGDAAISMTDKGLISDNQTITLDWKNGQILNTVTEVLAIDWNNKTLNGTWICDNLINNSVTNPVLLTGNQTVSGNKLFRDSLLFSQDSLILNQPTGAINYVGITYNNVNLLDFSTRSLYTTSGGSSVAFGDPNNLGLYWTTNASGVIEKLNWTNSFLKRNDAGISLDWENRILSGIWLAEEINSPILKAHRNDDTKIDLINSYLYDGTPFVSVDWANDKLYENANLSLDWSNRILTGNWKAQSLQISGGNPVLTVGNQVITGVKSFRDNVILSGNAPATSTSAGIKGQIATSGAFLFIATGTNLWGRVALSNW